MNADREPLCPRCGSAIYVRVSETESRCSECGLGFTTGTLRVELHEPSEVGAASRDDVPDRLVDLRRRMTGAFAEASFSPCGLDERWQGTRWLGGDGNSNGVVTRLELAHGEAPWDEASPQVRVDVRLPRRVGAGGETDVELERGLLARDQVSRLWMATGALDPEVRAAAFSTGGVPDEWMAPWADAEIAIDGTPVAFRQLGDDGYWLAQATHGRLLVAIESLGWPVGSTGLVTIEDLTPYIEGSALIAAEGRRRFGGR